MSTSVPLSQCPRVPPTAAELDVRSGGLAYSLTPEQEITGKLIYIYIYINIIYIYKELPVTLLLHLVVMIHHYYEGMRVK